MGGPRAGRGVHHDGDAGVHLRDRERDRVRHPWRLPHLRAAAAGRQRAHAQLVGRGVSVTARRARAPRRAAHLHRAGVAVDAVASARA